MPKLLLTSFATALLLFTGCNDEPKQEASAPATAETAEQNVPMTSGSIYGVDSAALSQTAPETAHAPQAAPQQSVGAHNATVIETVDAAGYTYVKVDENGQQYWIAGPKTTVQAGDVISYVEQMWMHDFQSKALNKTFDRLMFVTTIVPANATTAAADDCSNCDTHKAQAAAAAQDNTPVTKAEGGYTVEEVYGKKAELSEKNIAVKGKVVKVSRGIMGKDWVHLQDGTGAQGTNDLVITTAEADVNEGDVVTAFGVVKTDVDLGYGYTYAVLLERATFAK